MSSIEFINDLGKLGTISEAGLLGTLVPVLTQVATHLYASPAVKQRVSMLISLAAVTLLRISGTKGFEINFEFLATALTAAGASQVTVDLWKRQIFERFPNAFAPGRGIGTPPEDLRVSPVPMEELDPESDFLP